VTNQLKYLSLNHYEVGKDTSSSSSTQLVDVHSIQSINLKGKQQPRWNKNKNHNNNHKGGNNNNNNNNNKSKDDHNNDKSNNNVGEGNKEKRKVKFPCNLCKEDHLTHLCPKIEEASSLIV
jgi:hypothetical protein